MSKNMKFRQALFTILFVFFYVSICMAGPELPSGWRELKNEEIKDDPLGYRAEDPSRYLSVEADFNNDGQRDIAKILVNDSNNLMGLFVFLSQHKKYKIICLEKSDDKSHAIGMGISKVEPGKYKTACGKGYWDCSKGEPESIEIKYPAIDYFAFGSANSFYVWDPLKMEFCHYWMSD